MALDKPLPVPTPTSKPFWAGLNEETINMQQCEECGAWVFYPRTHCSSCLGTRLAWQEVSGDAVLYTFTVARQPTAPHFTDETPQRLAVVELVEQGVRLTTTLVNIKDTDIEIGMRLEPYFDHVTDEVTLLRYQPAQ